MPPIDPLEPFGQPGDPQHPADLDNGLDHDLNQDIVDIGVGADAPTRPQKRVSTASSTGSPLRVVGAIAAVVAGAALLVGLFGNGDAERAESPLPAPTELPEVLDDLSRDGTGDPARPAPTPTVQVPVVSDGLLRAGEACRIPLDDDGTQVVFTVPDGRTLQDCGDDGQLLRDPGSERVDALGSVFFSPQTLGLNLNRLRGVDDWAEAATVWRPVDNRRGYQLRRVTEDLGAWDRLDLIEVPGGTLVVAGRNRNYAPGIPQMIQELVATVRVEGPEALPAPPLPQTGGWCGDEDFVTQVPAGWFAGEQCRWLNTSSESPIVLQCECLPPLWIESLDIPFDGDFGFSSIDVDRVETLPNGTVGRIIEGLRRDANNMDRPLRVVVVDGGIKRVTVVATEFPEHVLPGHTWQDTLDAQQFLLTNLRFHSQPGCGGTTERLVVDPDGRTGIQTTGEFVGLPQGTLVETTGCADEESVEVQLVAAPEVVGWMERADLREQTIELCRSGETDFRPHEWLSAVVGDFDGDGRDDAAYLRDNRDGGSDVAVLYANGGLAEGMGLAKIDELPSVERYVGLGRDVLQVVERHDRGVIVSLLDASPCEVAPLASWPLGFVDGARHNICVASDSPLQAFRVWSESFDDRQGWIVESDRFWFPEDGTFTSIELDQSSSPSNLCGPVLTEFAPEVRPTSIAGGELAGEHQLTLQWIETRDETTGTVEFTPIGNNRYEVDGVHEAAFGFLSMRGVIERVDEETFVFEGTITSQIPWLNLGEPCIRKAGQRFTLRTDTATPTFRLQDRINCDGARTDWIDLQLSW